MPSTLKVQPPKPRGKGGNSYIIELVARILVVVGVSFALVHMSINTRQYRVVQARVKISTKDLLERKNLTLLQEQILASWSDVWGTMQKTLQAKPKSAFPPAETHDTSIIITSNLIPSHPSIHMVNTTIHSLSEFLVGLPLDTPIFVTVDKPPDWFLYKDDNPQRLQAYIETMQNTDFSPLTNVKVVPMKENLHLSGSINYTLATYVETPFVYILQHDLPFRRYVDHTTLVETMKQNPDILYNVRFRLHNMPWMRRSNIPCGVDRNVTQLVPPAGNQTGYQEVQKHVHYVGGHASGPEFNGLQFYLTRRFSDNNHLTTKKYYTEMLAEMDDLHLAMESVRDQVATRNCFVHGQQLYGNKYDDEPYIYHLDGRERYGANRGAKSAPSLRGLDPLAEWT